MLVAGVDRRGTVAIGIALVVVVSGTGIASAVAGGTAAATERASTETAADGVELRHATDTAGAHGIPSGEERVSSEDVHVDTAGGGTFEFGGDSDNTLRIVDPETGESITVEPLDGESTYTVEDVEIDFVAGERLQRPYRLFVEGPNTDHARVEVSFDGDTEMFSGEVFTPHVVELVNGSGEVVSSTDEATIGTGYRFDVEYNGSAVGVTRADEVEEDWYVRFHHYESNTLRVVNHTDSDDYFVVSTDDFEVTEGDSISVDIYRNRSDATGDRLVTLIGGDVPEPSTGPIGGDDGDDGGSGSTGAVELRHSPSGAGWVATEVENGTVVSEEIEVDTAGDGTFRLGGDSGNSLRVATPATGESVTVEPLETESAATIESLELGFRPGVDPRLNSRLAAHGPDGDVDWINVSVSGDTGLFSDRVLTSHVVELVNETGDVVAATDDATIATGYEYDVVYNGSAVGVTRADAVEEDWYVEFRQGSGGDRSTARINHTDSDDYFVVSTDEVDFDANESFDVAVYGNESDRLGHRIGLLRVSELPERTEGPIEGDDEGADDGDENADDGDENSEVVDDADSDGDGEIDLIELGEAAKAFSAGELSLIELGTIASAYTAS